MKIEAEYDIDRFGDRGRGPLAFPSEANLYRVPRRFGMRAMMAGMTFLSLLIAFLAAAGTPLLETAFILGLIAAVGAAQLCLDLKGDPRIISVLAGALFTFVFVAFYFLVSHGTAAILDAFVFGCLGSFPGAVAGYFAGGIVAGIFLILDHIDRFLRSSAASRERLHRERAEVTRQ